jgi:hypothetical protein
MKGYARLRLSVCQFFAPHSWSVSLSGLMIAKSVAFLQRMVVTGSKEER